MSPKNKSGGCGTSPHPPPFSLICPEYAARLIASTRPDSTRPLTQSSTSEDIHAQARYRHGEPRAPVPHFFSDAWLRPPACSAHVALLRVAAASPCSRADYASARFCRPHCPLRPHARAGFPCRLAALDLRPRPQSIGAPAFDGLRLSVTVEISIRNKIDLHSQQPVWKLWKKCGNRNKFKKISFA